MQPGRLVIPPGRLQVVAFLQQHEIWHNCLVPGIYGRQRPVTRHVMPCRVVSLHYEHACSAPFWPIASCELCALPYSSSVGWKRCNDSSSLGKQRQGPATCWKLTLRTWRSQATGTRTRPSISREATCWHCRQWSLSKTAETHTGCELGVLPLAPAPSSLSPLVAEP